MPKVSVAHTRSHLSELIARSAHGHERFIITRRNKPVAALVSIDDLKIIEQHKEQAGLAEVAGMWPEFDDLCLVRGNTRHFSRIPGLKLENWLAE